MSKSRTFGFWISAALGLALALVVGVFQVDRAARENSAMVRLVPAGLGGFSDERRFGALLVEDADAAEFFIDAIVANRPVDGDHLAQVALLGIEQGNADLATKALTSASTRGWRNEFVQISVLAAATQQGQPKEAALRLDALSRIEASDEVIFRALEALLLQPATAREIGPLVAESDFLARSLIRYSRRTPESAPRLAAAIRPSQNISCESITALTLATISQGFPDLIRIWRNRCEQSASDGRRLAMGNSEQTPFVWRFDLGAGTSGRPGTKADTFTLHNRTIVDQAAALHFLALSPGNYSFEIRVEPPANQSFALEEASREFVIICVNPDGRRVLSKSAFDNEAVLSFSVPPGCPIQIVQIELGRGMLRNVSIGPIRKVSS